jgi:type II secretory pathway pseudopilin PulG
MAALLVSLAVMSVLMSVALPAWRHAAQREKEAELVFRGEQYARAIALYRAKNANAFPPSVDILVQGKFLRKKYLDPITKKDFDVIGVGAQSAVPGQPAGTGTTTASGRGQSGQTTQTGRGTSGAQSSPGRGSSTSPSGFTSAPGITNNAFINSATGAVSGGIMGVHSKSQETSIRIYKGQTRYDQWNFVVTAVNRPGGGAGALNPGGQGGSPLPGARGGRGNANPGTNAPGGRGGPGRGPGTGGQGFPPPPPPPPPPFGVPRGPGGAGSDPNF